MKVRFFSSLGFKLFCLIGLVVLLTVAGNSWQNSRTFGQFLNQQVQDTTIMQADGTANEIKAILDNWIGQIRITVPILSKINPNKWQDRLAAFLTSNKEYLNLSVIQQVGGTYTSMNRVFTQNVSDPRFGDKNHKKIHEQLEKYGLAYLKARKHTGKIFLKNLTPRLDLPVLNIYVPFVINPETPEYLWVVLSVWQTEVRNTLPNSSVAEAIFLDHTGRVVSSHSYKYLKTSGRLSKLKVVSSAIKNTNNKGFVGEYQGYGKRQWIGAYTKIPDYQNAFVIMQRDATTVYAAIQKIIKRTALFACLFILLSFPIGYFGANTITKTLRDVTNITQRISMGDFSSYLQPRGRDEVSILSHAVNHMSQQIVKLMHSQVEKAQIEKELETAKMVQSTFFPRQDIESNDLKVSGFFEPASECGGDLWGHFKVDDKTEYVFIADATGHGVPAALVTAIAYSTYKSIADILATTDHDAEDPATILERLNRILFEALKGALCMTFFLAKIDLAKGEIVYSNAGHNPPVLLPAEAQDDRAGKVPKSFKKISDIPPINLNLESAPLGLQEDSTYKLKSIPMRAGDKLFLYTDGLIECRSPSGDMMGKKQMVKTILEVAKDDLFALKDHVVQRAFEFFDGVPLDDDITLVVVEVSKSWVATPVTPEKPQEPSPPELPEIDVA